MTDAGLDAEKLVRHYDDVIFDPIFAEYFGESLYANFGYWEEDTPTPERAGHDLVEKLLEFIPNKTGTILDVACGKGAAARHLLNYYPPDRITGINISEKQLQACRRNAPGCRFELMSATAPRFDDASFDNILCVEAAFHFDTREEFFRQTLRILKPGGRLALSDILMTLEAERRRAFRTEKNFLPDLNAYRALLERVGFVDVELADVTEQCWRRYYWRVVRFLHQKFLDRQIDRERLNTLLEPTYQRVPDMICYLLACARKP